MGWGGTDIFTQDFLYIGEKVAKFLEIALGTGLFTSFIYLFVLKLTHISLRFAKTELGNLSLFRFYVAGVI